MTFDTSRPAPTSLSQAIQNVESVIPVQTTGNFQSELQEARQDEVFALRSISGKSNGSSPHYIPYPPPHVYDYY